MRSRPSSGRRRGHAPHEFLVDRSLSQVLPPTELRRVGLIVYTLTNVYGELGAQAVEDTEWISLAAQRGWVVLTKDDRIRRRPAERQAIEDGKVRVFCLTNAGLAFAEQADYFISNRFRIIQASRRPGPYVYGVYRDRIRKLWPSARCILLAAGDSDGDRLLRCGRQPHPASAGLPSPWMMAVLCEWRACRRASDHGHCDALALGPPALALGPTWMASRARVRGSR